MCAKTQIWVQNQGSSVVIEVAQFSCTHHDSRTKQSSPGLYSSHWPRMRYHRIQIINYNLKMANIFATVTFTETVKIDYTQEARTSRGHEVASELSVLSKHRTHSLLLFMNTISFCIWMVSSRFHIHVAGNRWMVMWTGHWIR